MIIIADRLIFRADREEMHDGAVLIRSGKIIAVGSTSQIVRRYPGHRATRLENTVLMPGLVNVHAHLELPPLMDRIRSASYPQWVLNLLKFKKRLAPEEYALAAKSNIDSLIATGTTMVADISTHNVSPAVLRKCGLRSIVYRELISMGRSPRIPRIALGRRIISPLVRVGLSPHSPHTVSETALQKVHRYASAFKIRVCMHVAETKDELSLLRGRSSGVDVLYAAAGWDTSWAPRARSPFSYLERIGILNRRFLAVHAVHADDNDIRIIRRTGSGVAHCPRSNCTLGVGRMRLASFLRSGIPVGLGTDSLASVPSLSLWDEMRYAHRIHRSSGVTADDIMLMATMGGAKALGMDREIGSIEPGKQADIIAVPLPQRKTGSLASNLLRETKSCIMTMVNGKIIYQQDPEHRK